MQNVSERVGKLWTDFKELVLDDLSLDPDEKRRIEIAYKLGAKAGVVSTIGAMGVVAESGRALEDEASALLKEL